MFLQIALGQKKKKKKKNSSCTRPKKLHNHKLIHTNINNNYKNNSVDKFHLEAKIKFPLVLGNFPFPTILVLTSHKNLLQNLFLRTRMAQMLHLISCLPYIVYDRAQHKATQQTLKSLGLPIPSPQLLHFIQDNR
jgi:hypothetical protein